MASPSLTREQFARVLMEQTRYARDKAEFYRLELEAFMVLNPEVNDDTTRK